MATLSTRPRSSTPNQRKALVLAGRRRGMDVDGVRRMAGGSLTALSADAASALITRLTGRGLPNPPGKKPSVYPGRPEPGVTRLITADQVSHIRRLLAEYFEGDMERATGWLRKDFKLNLLTPVNNIDTQIRQLETSKKANQLIRVLKEMIAR